MLKAGAEQRRLGAGADCTSCDNQLPLLGEKAAILHTTVKNVMSLFSVSVS